jgi:hypothetical protein
LIISTSCIFTGPSLKGNGNVVEENRKTDDFEEIKVSRGMNVYLSQGDFTKVFVKADENLLDAIETRMEGDVLKITTNANIRNATEKKVYITAPDISSIHTSAGSNVYSETLIKSKNLDLSCSAGSNVKLEVETGNLEVSVSAGSNVKLDGETDFMHGKASSGSNIKAEGLTTAKCEARVSSGANIWISVQKDLQAHASSGGNIFYYGQPETTDIEKSSGGNVIKK